MKKVHFTFLIRIIIAVLALFAFSFFYWYGKVDLFYFPFNAKVWGTASDWIMVTVTFITAILLYKTLISQQRTLHEQIKITRIESENRKLKIVPRFSIGGIQKNGPQTDQYIINRAPYFSSSNILNIDLQLSFDDADGNPYTHNFGIVYQNANYKIFHEVGPIPDTSMEETDQHTV